MAHRSPATASWELAARSVEKWRRLVAQDPDLRRSVEWQDTGSLLLAGSEAETGQLRDRQALLHQNGISSRMLEAEEVVLMEPSLDARSICGGLVTESDAQIVSVNMVYMCTWFRLSGWLVSNMSCESPIESPG
jgi:glycine/D-amino acid oxidase-like deaminating enzyme